MNSIDEKLVLLRELEEIRYSGYIGLPTGLLAHAVLNTIDLFELVKMYINQLYEEKIIADNILKRLQEDSQRVAIFDYVFDHIRENQNYTNRLRFKKLLMYLLDEMDDERIMEFFSYFYRSRYVYEVRTALDVARRFWSPKMQEIVLNDYLETLDNDRLLVLIDCADNDVFMEIVKNRWTEKDIPTYLKVRFIKRLRGLGISDFLFLREIDPNNFLGLLLFCKEPIDKKMVAECYNRVEDKYKPFAIWTVAKLGYWDIVKPSIKSYIQKPENKYPGFSSIMFD
ncbi:hypothetical protein GCM10023231_17230 [Olivibacter ginsenosidimutans]|uniref:DNA alkylation repair protein n=1 Tax=Olivibacter ginsenosidimutans TaxID=1176537 RepID=A0ABP9B2R1_9SPHI